MQTCIVKNNRLALLCNALFLVRSIGNLILALAHLIHDSGLFMSDVAQLVVSYPRTSIYMCIVLAAARFA